MVQCLSPTVIELLTVCPWRIRFQVVDACTRQIIGATGRALTGTPPVRAGRAAVWPRVGRRGVDSDRALMRLLLEHAPFNFREVDLLASDQSKQMSAQNLVEVIVHEKEESAAETEGHDHTWVHFFGHGLEAEDDEGRDPEQQQEEKSEHAILVAAFHPAGVEDGHENGGDPDERQTVENAHKEKHSLLFNSTH